VKKGKIIWLNGVSSAGKSTLAKTLQKRLPEPFYHLSIDRFYDIFPAKFMETNPAKTFSVGLSGFHYAIKTYSDIGINVVVDHVFLKGDGKDYTLTGLDTMEECVALLHEHDVLFVHVTCPPDELRRREKERGDRSVGGGEKMLPRLNPQDTYDVTVDTYKNSKEECAEKIIELLKSPENNTAFKTLWAQRIT
jgi:chloramphenicol 3-O phosphotransferase